MDRPGLLCLILLIILFSGCTEKSPDIKTANLTHAAATPAFTAPEPPTVYIEIKGSAFNPRELRISRGTTVRWTNMDSALHIVNGDGFMSPALNKRDAWNHTFNRTGRFDYGCSMHASMRGRIIVD